jgi:hypothetical protein
MDWRAHLLATIYIPYTNITTRAVATSNRQEQTSIIAESQQQYGSSMIQSRPDFAAVLGAPKAG